VSILYYRLPHSKDIGTQDSEGDEPYQGALGPPVEVKLGMCVTDNPRMFILGSSKSLAARLECSDSPFSNFFGRRIPTGRSGSHWLDLRITQNRYTRGLFDCWTEVSAQNRRAVT
jgi:hypothetical protein